MKARIETRQWHVTPARMVWLTVALALVLAPHLPRIPVWIGLTFAVLALWRLVAEMRGLRMPPRMLMIGACLFVLAGVYLSYGTATGRGPGVAMLAALAGLKLVETKALRDAYVVCFLGFFLVITNFLFSDSIPTGVYMFVVVLVLLGALSAMAIDEGARLSLPVRLRLAGTLVLQAVPIMLVLFVLFPRVSGPLWGLPKDAASGITGLSDVMSPGSVTRLGLSDAVAFRVHFDGPRPPPDELYWRGPVLWRTDGRNWRMRHERGLHRPTPFEKIGRPVDYTVTLEPTARHMLFALDLPATLPPRARMTEDFQIRTTRPVNERVRYHERSYLHYRTEGGLSRERRDEALRLPPFAHPRARALAHEWQAGGADAATIVARALAWFRREPFVYTLTPKPLPGDVIDEFLFQTREGFCENFAAAFTVLMRAAGVPARVVTGYQGGEYNPVGDYLIVRQRDAHAWTEVWLDGQGWVRVDPTATVAPERIRQGMDAAIPPTIGPAVLDIRPTATVLAAWERMRLAWDTVNSAWNEWVLGYGPERQQVLLGRFGIDARDLASLALGILAATGLLLAGITLWLLRGPRGRDPVLRAWRRFERRLARAGLGRRPNEGPVDYGRRVARARPAVAADVEAIVDLYVSLRYAPPRGADPRALARAVAAFRA